VLSDKRIEQFLFTLDPTVLDGRCAVQDRLSCQHSCALVHEDRPGAGFVQEFLEGERPERRRLQRLSIHAGGEH
jgi:hypothetical protein